MTIDLADLGLIPDDAEPEPRFVEFDPAVECVVSMRTARETPEQAAADIRAQVDALAQAGLLPWMRKRLVDEMTAERPFRDDRGSVALYLALAQKDGTGLRRLTWSGSYERDVFAEVIHAFREGWSSWDGDREADAVMAALRPVWDGILDRGLDALGL